MEVSKVGRQGGEMSATCGHLALVGRRRPVDLGLLMAS